MLEEPPRARSTRMAFSKAARVRILRGVRFSWTRPTIFSPEAKAIRLFSEETQEAVPQRGRLIPKVSVRIAMVLAVNNP